MSTTKTYEAGRIQNIVQLKLNCFSLLQDGFIPSRYTSDGININPALYIDEIPDGAQSFAVIVEDPDVPHDSFCHWVAWNIPVTHYIKEKENRGLFGINDFCNHGYNGPHPFSTVHRYHFKVYALDCVLDIPESSTRWELKWAMQEHIIGFGLVVGKYQKHSTTTTRGIFSKAGTVVGDDLKMLLEERRGVCVSIILSLRNLPARQSADKVHLSKAIKEACDRVSVEHPAASPGIITVFKKIQDDIVLKPSDQGIGIFVSEDAHFYTTFPFQVSEKIVIGQRFHVKELLIKEHYSLPYTLVYVDEMEIRLYSGKANELTEVKNTSFPMFFEEALEVQSPLINSFFARNAYIKNEKNTKEQLEIDHKKFIERASTTIQSYVQSSEVVLLAGVRKYLYELVYHTGLSKKIVNSFYGNYGRFNEKDFTEMVWPSVKNYIDGRMPEEVEAYNEKLAEGITEEGIVHVWDAVASDRGETLFVEKKIEIEGFIEHQNPARLYLHPPATPHKVLPDAVDEIIKMALDKDLNIVFVKDGMLNRNMRIALITKF
jgi:Raf kinase inhibitor-like YbhB/YbcL family protein